MTIQNQCINPAYFIAGTLLLIPAIAMQFTSEVNWSAFDFLVAGVLLFGTALGVDLISKHVKPKGKAWIFIGVLLLLIAILWIELAVGLFGSPIAGS